MMHPADHDQRQRFITELDQSFSVIAPAGVGKTQAISKRIAAIALAGESVAKEMFPRLVVVTFTRKAASEMRQRARRELLGNPETAPMLRYFQRAFFGTIHGFCLRLISGHGHHLGLPRSPGLDEENQAAWQAFLDRGSMAAHLAGEPWMTALARHTNLLSLVTLARTMPPGDFPAPVGELPRPDIEPILGVVEKGSAKENIKKSKAAAVAWLEAFDRGDELAFTPPCEVWGASKDLLAAWTASFGRQRLWLGEAALAFAGAVATEWRRDRVESQQLSYFDQVRLAGELLRNPKAAEGISRQRHIVILDEAQDTDPAQFEVLLGVSGAGGPDHAKGRFCMVGDFQQSIYRDRADLSEYRRIHTQLLESGGEALAFVVTFRCDEAIIGFLNSTLPAVLSGNDGQASYVPLETRRMAGPGQVVRLEVPGVDEFLRNAPDKIPVLAAADFVAQGLAKWLETCGGPGSLGARHWGEVAVLCPRNGWFDAIEQALHHAGLRTRKFSGKEVRGDHPAFAWFTALMTILSDPENGYEIAGVLREIFGITDQDLADYTDGDGDLLHLHNQRHECHGAVDEALKLLSAAAMEAARLPLRDAVEMICVKTRLRDRLLSLPSDAAPEAAGMLQSLISRASEAEGNTWTLRDFAEDLRKAFLENAEPGGPDPGAINLISCQKAKGLEWDVVIVPEFFRNISIKDDPFPCVRGSVSAGDTRLLFAKVDATAEALETLDQEKKQDLERLLYVTLTRARKTLVLVDDRLIFEHGRRPRWSFGRLLLAGDATNSRWEGLKTTLLPPVTEEVVEVHFQPPNFEPAAFGDLVRLARSSAEVFSRRILPHRLAHHPRPPAQEEEPEWRLAVDAVNDEDHREDGREYGIWWHFICQFCPWMDGPLAWHAYFHREVATSPQPDRARADVNRFMISELADHLSRGRFGLIRTEMPFISTIAGTANCLEGLVDLVAMDFRRRRGLVVDWKTDLPADGVAGPFPAQYRPQIEAYARSLTARTGMPFSGSIYSVMTGEWHSVVGGRE